MDKISSMPIFIAKIILILWGGVLAVGGTQLLLLGGSVYYLMAGLAIMLTGILLFLRKSLALVVYAGVVLGSLVWAIWEVGLDWWQLGPRGGVVILIGLWLLTPWIRKPLGCSSPTGTRYAAGAAPLAASVALAIVVAIVSFFVDPHNIDGELPEEKLVAAPAMGNEVPPGEWHQYGRTNFGQRFSPLDQVNVDNVANLDAAWRYQTGDVKLPADVVDTTSAVR